MHVKIKYKIEYVRTTINIFIRIIQII